MRLAASLGIASWVVTGGNPGNLLGMGGRSLKRPDMAEKEAGRQEVSFKAHHSATCGFVFFGVRLASQDIRETDPGNISPPPTSRVGNGNKIQTHISVVAHFFEGIATSSDEANTCGLVTSVVSGRIKSQLEKLDAGFCF